MAKIEEKEIQIGGRITLPKSWREKYGLKVGTKVRMIAMDRKIEIEVPTKLVSLYGLIRAKKPSEQPKKEAREYMKKTIKGELGE